MKKVNKTITITLDPLYDSTSIFISLEVSIEDSGILFNKFNGVYFKGDALFEGDTVPTDVKIVNKGSELKGKKFKLFSRYNVIAPTEDEAVFPKVTWKPNLEAGDHTLYDTEESGTSDDNMFEYSVTFIFN